MHVLHVKTKIGDAGSYLSWWELMQDTAVHSLWVKVSHLALIQREGWEIQRSTCRSDKQTVFDTVGDLNFTALRN